MMKTRVMFGAAMIAAMSIAAFNADSATAEVISGNYCSVAPIADFPAGVVPVGGWNDYTVPGGFPAPTATVSGGPDLAYNTGAQLGVGTTISWATPNGGAQNTNDSVTRPTVGTLGGDIDDGHDQMMTGYLQATRFTASAPTVTLAGDGMSAAVGSDYSVILYIDGDGDVQPSSATANNQYSVSIWTDNSKTTSLGTTVFGRDAGTFAVDHTVAGVLTDFVEVTSTTSGTPTVGNYVRFDGLSSDSFYIEIVGVAGGIDGLSNDGGHGVALNGFQIVPEPATMSLLGLGGLVMLRRKRKG